MSHSSLAVRVRGFGWIAPMLSALGVGRLGAAIGVLLGGGLMARRRDHATRFCIEAIPLYSAAIACLALRRRFPPGLRIAGWDPRV